MLDIAQTITDKIISELEKGSTPWVKPWKRLRGTPGHGMPYNPVSGTVYSGMNHIWLSMMQGAYPSPYWLTLRHANQIGGHVKANEKGTPIVAFKIVRKETLVNGKKETSAYPMIRHHYVYNVAQCEDITIPDMPVEPEPTFNPDSSVMALVDKLGLENGLTHSGDSAFYSPTRDFISMPPMAAFNSANGYHSTLLHESVHATGHKSRLDRDFSKRFGDESYAFEELVAELGAAMLCAHCGIDGEMQENHVAYIANWLTVLKNDKKAILTASAKAQQALDWLTKAKQVEESESLAA
jgi:antirestriction protein ArdC